jgi:hypothetical protein
MRSNQQRESVSQLATAKAFAHDQMLLRAAYKAQRVLYRGSPEYVQFIKIDANGSAVETEVYLRGNSTPIPASEITLAPEVE